MIEAIIVDDESPSRRRLRDLLDIEEDFRVTAECASGVEALTKVREVRPDVIFLDVRMPGMSGLELLGHLGDARRPHVVFVTAFVNHAVAAFELHAVDYLVKPIEGDRFKLALERIRERVARDRIHAGSGNPGLTPAFMDGARVGAAVQPRHHQLVVKSGRTLKVLDPDKIMRIESDGDYSDIRFLDGSTLRTMEKIHLLDTKLAENGFMRIHRTAIVNASHITALSPSGRGQYRITMSDGWTCSSGATFNSAISDWIAAHECAPPSTY